MEGPAKITNATVTGATGFLGKHLVKALVESGAHVTAIVRKISDIALLKQLGVTLVYGKMSDSTFLKNNIKEGDVFFHLAAMLGGWGVKHDEIYHVNVNLTNVLLKVCKENKVSQFIYCSTPGVIGKTGQKNANEEMPYNPPYAYEKTKCEAEKAVMFFFKEHGLKTTIIRPDFVYGPYDYRRIKLYRAIKNKKFLIVGNGKTYLHPTYIDDVVQGFLLAINNPKAIGNIYNIAGPSPLSVNEYVEGICQVLGVPVPNIKIPKYLSYCAALAFEGLSKITKKEPFISRSKVEFLTISHGSDISRAKLDLGFNPNCQFIDGIKKTVDWACSRSLL